MNRILAAWNNADEAAACDAMMACCGAERWAAGMVALRPVTNATELSEMADRLWSTMEEPDWLEAFACHPRIGEREPGDSEKRSAAWSRQEQSGAGSAGEAVLAELAEGNKKYEERFGFTYIVCATGKSAEEMLRMMKRRLTATREAELREAAEEQRQIMHIRLGKWLTE